MMNLAVFVFFIIQVDTSWVRTYNGPGNGADITRAMVVDESGNVYITGYSYGVTTGRDYATLKYDSNGNLLWTARYDGPTNEDDEAYDITIDGSGNVYVTGRSGGIAGHYPRHMDYATIKYDSDGNELWAERYDDPQGYDDEARAIAIDSSGNVYATGTIPGPSSLPRIGTVKYNNDGDFQWASIYAPSGYWEHYGADILADAAGNIYVAAVAIIPECDYWVIKYAPSGSIIWERNYSPAADYGWSCLALDSGNNLFLAGGSGENYSTSYYDYLLMKYSTTGTELWKRFYNGPVDSFDIINAIVIDDAGMVYVTGESQGNDLSRDYATIKFDNSGSQSWATRYSESANSNDRAYGIDTDDLGNVFVTGVSDGDYATVMYNTAGQELWVERYSPGTPCGVCAHNPNSIYVTGTSNNDYLTIKYNYIVGAEETVQLTQVDNGLLKVCPNPFTNRIDITLSVPYRAESIELRIFDTAGKLVKAFLLPNTHCLTRPTIIWDGRDEKRRKVPAGVYFCRLETDGFSQTRKLILLR